MRPFCLHSKGRGFESHQQPVTKFSKNYLAGQKLFFCHTALIHNKICLIISSLAQFINITKSKVEAFHFMPFAGCHARPASFLLGYFENFAWPRSRYFAGILMGAFAYADDIVLIAPCVNALRKMIAMCEEYAVAHTLSFNASKMFSPQVALRVLCHSLRFCCVVSRFFVARFCYLGVWLNPLLDEWRQCPFRCACGWSVSKIQCMLRKVWFLRSHGFARLNCFCLYVIPWLVYKGEGRHPLSFVGLPCLPAGCQSNSLSLINGVMWTHANVAGE